MPERTLYYWSKMYTMQVKSGDTYDILKKCITINIVHFMELPKLFDDETEKDENDPIVQWMEFIEGKSKGVMEMLANKNDSIKKAYNVLQIISKDENARMVYEAREAELRDQLTRIRSAEEKGKTEGMIEGKIETAKNLLQLGVSTEIIMKATELSEHEIIRIRRETNN